MRELVAVNGKVSSPEEATVSVFDRGFLYGDSIYEVVRSYDRTLFAIEPHIARLFRSALSTGIDIGKSQQELIQEIKDTYAKSEIDNAYVRIIVTRGGGPISLDPSLPLTSTIVIMVKEIPAIDGRWYTDGIDLIIPSVLRNSKRALDPNIKSGNYLNNILAFGEARKRKAHDAVLLNQLGQVTECTTSNIFMVENGVLIGPPDDADILHGITRGILKDICKAHGLFWKEEMFDLGRLMAAQEVFLTGSVKEIVPVRKIDERILKGVPGPVTKRLSNLYKEYVLTYCLENKVSKNAAVI